MLFVVLSKWKGKPGKQNIEKTNKVLASAKVKNLGFYWTFGRYDAVLIAEAPDWKTMMKTLLQVEDMVTTETMLAVPREEAVKLL
jgi:uncharacterized protein with GYD domain